jgi:hypothetical protein
MLFSILIFLVYFLIGSFIGNAATSFIFRIPRELPLCGFNLKPICGGMCGLELKFKDFVPIYRYFFISKFCKCGKYSIPSIYPVAEVTSGLAIAFIGLKFHDNEYDLLRYVVLFFGFLVNACIYKIHKRLFQNSVWIFAFCMLVFVALNRSDMELIDIFCKLFLCGSFLNCITKKNPIDPLLFRFFIISIAGLTWFASLIFCLINLLTFVVFKNINNHVRLSVNFITLFILLFFGIYG